MLTLLDMISFIVIVLQKLLRKTNFTLQTKTEINIELNFVENM